MGAKSDRYRVTFGVKYHKRALARKEADAECKKKTEASVVSGACDAVLIGIRKDSERGKSQIVFDSVDSETGRYSKMSADEKWLMWTMLANDLIEDMDLCGGKKMLCKVTASQVELVEDIAPKLRESGLEGCSYCMAMVASQAVAKSLSDVINKELKKILGSDGIKAGG